MSGSRDFGFAGERFSARRSGALWWPARSMLIVSDLHLGRTERYARRGGALLPPWHDSDTLRRLEAEVAALNPGIIVSLGDSFDDDEAAMNPDPALRLRLQELAQRREMIWIDGNHDPAPLSAELPGVKRAELSLTGITLRHATLGGAALSGAETGEISGHLHPVAALAGKRWRSFALGAQQLILPAFGSYTGGLEISSPEFRRFLPQGLALCCSEAMFVLPFPGRRSQGR